jgi:hypothetical protein
MNWTYDLELEFNEPFHVHRYLLKMRLLLNRSQKMYSMVTASDLFHGLRGVDAPVFHCSQLNCIESSVIESANTIACLLTRCSITHWPWWIVVNFHVVTAILTTGLQTAWKIHISLKTCSSPVNYCSVFLIRVLKPAAMNCFDVNWVNSVVSVSWPPWELPMPHLGPVNWHSVSAKRPRATTSNFKNRFDLKGVKENMV